MRNRRVVPGDRPVVTGPPAGSAARRAVVAAFAVNGAVIGGMVVRTPSVKLDLALDDGRVGLISAGFGLSAVAAMQVIGPLAVRLGSAVVLRVALVALPLLLVASGAATGFGGLLAITVGLGLTHGSVDVGMNTHAVTVERVTGRPVLSTCHAAWSIGSLAGGSIGGWSAGHGLSRTANFTLVAALLVPAALLAGRFLLPAAADRRPRAAGAPVTGAVHRVAPRRRVPVPFRNWPPRLVLLGAAGAAVLCCEGSVANWAGVLLHDHLHASLGVAGIGYVVFVGCQTLGRLVGDRIIARHRASTVVRVGTGVAGVGFVIVVIAPSPWVCLVGIAVAGLGLAGPLPVVFGVVGHSGAQGPGAAVHLARLTTMTYAGILLGPVGIGWASTRFGLPAAIAGLAPLLFVVSAAAGGVRPLGVEPAEPTTEAAAVPGRR